MSDKEEIFERYSPQHPLPEKIQQMTRDETVCQYCGVSYLIHNEIKALEKKLQAAEKELEHLRGCEKREKDLEKKLEEAELRLRRSETSVDEGRKEKEILAAKLKTTEDSNKTLKDKNDKLEKTTETNRLRWVKMTKNLSNLAACVTLIKSSVKLMKSDVKQHDREREENFSQVRNEMINQLKSYIEDQQSKEDTLSRLGQFEMENTMLKQSVRDANEKLKSQTTKTEEMGRWQVEQEEKHKQLKDKITKLEENCKQQEQKAAAYKKELDSLQSVNRKLSMEIEQFQNQLKSKSKELDNVTGLLSKKDHQHEVSLNNIMVELKAKEGELVYTKKQLKNLENLYQEEIEKQKSVNNQAAATMSETKELKDALSQARADLEALKAERELMISTHHNRIEELRESFKNRMAETDLWPQKLAEAVQKEQNKHAIKVSELENKLKEDFVASLQVEKEKYDKLMQKYQEQLKNKDSEAKIQLQKQLAAVKSGHMTEVNTLRQQMADSKARAADNDKDLRKEIASLKKIISDLENRIGYLSEGSVDETNKLKQEMQQIKQELAEVKNRLSSTEGQLRQAKEEVLFLQETVQKECEERFELTEALSDARKELLQLKMPAGGYTPTNGQRPIANNLSSRTRTSISSESRQKIADFVSPANQTVGFHGDTAKPQGTLKGNSVSENRKRIAAILGKPS